MSGAERETAGADPLADVRARAEAWQRHQVIGEDAPWTVDDALVIGRQAAVDRDSLLSAIDAVRELHQPTRESFVFCSDAECDLCVVQGIGHDDVEVCDHCWTTGDDCDGLACNVLWPCPTVAALDGEPS